ncbi:efflux RND transporter periplasmic adaptor subunit [Paenibacillus aquistagni]|uniref:efflux RND transporter periplasmic adaptor subunit n=1 Tax=Paenibacillus aquistagni TaxID=1852522 RepID=UPI00145BB062|nr:efflux RND transporter periplasmic adaptor subunit [Paenibacillus aquistagni]NMM55037.1 efflux RND transporter periplasmic adaptor subunit [Paenibacillus aquistagni]
MKKKIKWLIVIIIVLGISYGLYQFSKPNTPAMNNNDLDSMITFDISKETLIHNIEVKGKSTYEKETIVYAPFTGKVEKWTMKDGQQVSKGDVLFQLSTKELKQDIAQTEANLKKQDLEKQLAEFQQQAAGANAAMEMTEEEAKRQFIERESAKLQRELSQVTTDIQVEDVKEKRNKMNQAQYKAATSGIFLYDDASKLPQLVQENERIGKIVDVSKLQLVTYVGEQDVFNIKEGMPVQVTINALKDITLYGDVLKVSKFAKSGTESNSSQPAQFEVIISLEKSEHLIAGLSLTGQIETERKEGVIVVPTVAVMKDEAGSYVMLRQSDGQIIRRDIQTGMETPEKIEVKEGLQMGDVVVLQ